jgi:hypothetical protein
MTLLWQTRLAKVTKSVMQDNQLLWKRSAGPNKNSLTTNISSTWLIGEPYVMKVCIIIWNWCRLFSITVCNPLVRVCIWTLARLFTANSSIMSSLVEMRMELTVHKVPNYGPLKTLTESLKHFPTPILNPLIELSDLDQCSTASNYLHCLIKELPI